MGKNLRSLIQSELKTTKRVLTVLCILAILSTVANIITIHKYNQLINKEKTFLNHAENVLQKIEINSHLEE